MDQSLERIRAILDKHSGLNFVQRVLSPDKYPKISNSDGSSSTHLMAYGEHDGKYIVFPTIIQYPNGKLQNLSMDRAFQHAINTGEFVPFKSADDADWFSQHYKDVWEK